MSRHQSRTSAKYWEGKVVRCSYVHRGQRIQEPNYSVQIQFQKRRYRFRLGTPNAAAAAARARDIYLSLQGRGWEETLQQYGVDQDPENEAAPGNTVGDLIRTACRLSTARPQSLKTYCRAFRRVVAAIAKISGEGKYDALKGGHEAWQFKVDAVPLSEITPMKVTAWKNAYLLKAASDPEQLKSAKTTVNSLIRNAKALFSKKLLPFLAQELELPHPLPFENVAMEKPPSMRYVSQIDAKAILRSANETLAIDDPEAFKALLLAGMCGLRISEIDHLLWTAFDFEAETLVVRDTKYHQLKSEDSAGEVDLTPEVASVFRGFLSVATGEFVIESPNPPRKPGDPRHYRCDKIFDRLRQWLRYNGVDAKKPIHELRKEIGSIIASEHDIFAASRYLRHSDIRITAAIYVDKKRKVTPSLQFTPTQ
ncbi:MAG: tyrosine-type recombinase/integrase [Planctomycetota bacterium]